MEDHPIFGAVLLVIGIVLIALVYYHANALSSRLFGSFVGVYTDEEILAISELILGHVFAFNGVILVVLGRRKLNRSRRRKRG